MAARTYTGQVTVVYPPESAPEALAIQVVVDGTDRPRVGDHVEMRVLLTDEQIGRRLRAMLTEGRPKPDKRRIREMADEIEEQCGWPALGDLIRAVIDA